MEFLAKLNININETALAMNKFLKMGIYKLPFYILTLHSFSIIGEEISFQLSVIEKAEFLINNFSRLSSHMAAALKIGLFYPARRKKTYPHLLFRHIASLSPMNSNW